MKIRVKFSRNEPVKYLGHLDILRFFQKCFVRAHVKMLYSEGFNPHQKMSFALPLGVGILSRAEYLDAEVLDGQDTHEIHNALGRECGCGFEILCVRKVKEDAASLMSVVRFALYEIECKNTEFFVPGQFMAQERIEAVKKTKKKICITDIKPLIHSFEYDEILKTVVSAGSENNLKPELLLEAICAYNNSEYKREDFEIRRTGLYGPQMEDLADYQTEHE